ncbi:uncharacterized protein K444DRAFT_229634 [Hyaloscypha bicolor E]|uniref:Uncharacterized protein n=1 Tax=Hyaloscypha bicolor E TaxID=1095630 RepID=A0A2J6SKR2_9HELO|nr:uncharacterized protein K444DRAFT_229634 [Hyaloscypha bicolor E]PMD51343.1 hypothetical protein K444DRAFT_229634 [Hyaloscypha bicolor E]
MINIPALPTFLLSAHSKDAFRLGWPLLVLRLGLCPSRLSCSSPSQGREPVAGSVTELGGGSFVAMPTVTNPLTSPRIGLNPLSTPRVTSVTWLARALGLDLVDPASCKLGATVSAGTAAWDPSLGLSKADWSPDRLQTASRSARFATGVFSLAFGGSTTRDDLSNTIFSELVFVAE